MNHQPSSAEKPKRRPRRIAADEAHAWARNLRLGNPFAKLVLSMLTIYVNGDGTCFVGIGDGDIEKGGLAADCELSPDTVRKRLAWLEQVGAIVRFPQWIDDSGRRNSEGRGRRTSDEIRLLIDADPDDIERRAKGEDVSVPEPKCNNVDPRQQQGSQPAENVECNIVSPALALRQPSDSSGGLISEPEPEDSTQSPSLNRAPSTEDTAFEEAWLRFVKAYPIDIGDVPLTRNLLRALSPDERDLVIFGAFGYAKFVTDQQRRSMDAHRFIRDSKWQGYVESGKLAAPKPPEPEKPRNRLLAGSSELIAFRLACKIAGMEIPKLIGDPPSIEIIGEVPHGAETMAALIDAGESWEVVAKHTAQFGAWRERVHEWTGRWIEPKRYWLNEQNQVVPTAKDAFVPKREDGIPSLPRSMDGLLVPHTVSGFPPPKSAREGPETQVA